MKNLIIIALLLSSIPLSARTLREALDANDPAGVRDAIAAAETWNDPATTALIHAAGNCSPAVLALVPIDARELAKRNMEGDTALLAACRRGNWANARYLIGKGAAVNVRGTDGKTPLYFAASADTATVAALLKARANPNSADQPLLAAAAANRAEALAMMHKAGGNIWKVRGIMHAAARGGAASLRYLLSKKMTPAVRHEGMLPLHAAAEAGRRDTVPLLVSKRMKIDTPDTAGNTSLLRYLKKQGAEANPEYVAFLIRYGAKINARNYAGESAVHMAGGNLALIRSLRRLGADINAPGAYGNTLLHLAVSDGGPERVRDIIAAGVGVNIPNRAGATPLDAAIRNARVPEAVELLKRGARTAISAPGAMEQLCIAAMDAPDNLPFILSRLMTKSGLPEPVLVRSLMHRDHAVFRAVWRTQLSCDDAGLDAAFARFINSRDERVSFLVSWQAFDDERAARSREFYTAAGEKTLAQVMRAAGPNVCGPDGVTPLMIAAQYGSAERTGLIMSLGGDAYRRDASGMTAVAHAAAIGNHEALRMLLSRKADADRADYDRWTPLMYAVRNGDLKCADILLEGGASVKATGYDGLTPMLIAQMRRHQRMVEILAAKGAAPAEEETPLILNHRLIMAAERGDADAVSALVSAVKDLDFRDRYGRTALHAAVTGANPACVKLLLDRNAQINLKSRTGETPLLISINSRQPVITELLLSKGADANTYDAAGRTPLVKAIMNESRPEVLALLNNGADVSRKTTSGTPPIFYLISDRQPVLDLIGELLRRRGADINQRDARGRTALMSAAMQGMRRAAEYLVTHGADMDCRDNAGKTAIDYAIASGAEDIVQYLIERGYDRSASGYAMIGDRRVAERRYSDAISYYSRALREDPTINVYANMGVAYYNLRGHGIARKCFSIALERNPEDPELYFNLACIAAAGRDRNKAIDYLEMALSKGYPDPEGISTDGRFAALKKEPRFTELLQRYVPAQ